MNHPVPCPESDLLRAILRGTVSPTEEERIARHLESCEQCRRTVDAIAGFDDGELTAVEVDEPSPIALPAIVNESIAPELRAVMDHLKEDDLAQRGASATEASDPLTQSLPSGMDAFIQHLLDEAEPGKPATIGHYELGKKIGRGGMGAVYQARDLKLNRQVAIKFLKPDLTRDGTFVERFIREAQAAAGIAHLNVVTVHGIEETNGVPWIVMELIKGESLRKRLRRMGPLTLTSVARIGAQIAEGLQAAHEKRLIHRDIKPSNIVLLDGTDEVRITDFGLVQLEGATRLTKSGLLMGTPKYMAPEQARGETVDHRSDLFSLGSVLYAMCVGHAPFSGKTDAEVVTHVAKNQLNRIGDVDPTLPRWLIDLIDQLLGTDPDDRFQSAREVAQILRANLEAGEFAELSTGADWGEVTAVDGSPAFQRDAAETIVEGQLPDPDIVPTGITAPLMESIESGEDTSPRARRSTLKQSQVIVLGGGLVALCLLVAFLVSLGGDNSDTSGDEQASGNGEFESMKKPLPEFGEGPFVLEQHDRRLRFPTLGDASQEARENETIYFEFDGKREIPQTTIRQKVTLAAGWNAKENRPYRPVLTRDLFDIGNGARALLIIDGSVRLEGLEIQYESEFSEDQRQRMSLVDLLEWAILSQSAANLQIVNCQIRMKPGDATQVAVKADRGSGLAVKNSEFFGGTAVAISSAQDLTMENSLTISPCAIVVLQQPGPNGQVEIRNCTFLNKSFLQLNLGRAPRGAVRNSRIRFDVRNCILDSTHSLLAVKQLAGAVMPLLPNEIRNLDAASLLVWGGADNVYDVARTYFSFLNTAQNPTVEYELFPKGITEWLEHWRDRDRNSRAARFLPAPRYEGFHKDLLKWNHSLQLKPQLDGHLPSREIGAYRETIGVGDGYENFLLKHQ